ncbi:hypothetical protein [Pararhizobium sp. A13]|uniref:hypothetical protein n=1 Tax=Pararhizobium sp. A13 TaxID=3133975 RepID=UPI00311B1943
MKHSHSFDIEATTIRALAHRKGKGTVAETLRHDLPRPREHVITATAVLCDGDMKQPDVPALGPVVHQVIPLAAHRGKLVTPPELLAAFVLDHDIAVARDIGDHRRHSPAAAERCHLHHGRLTAGGKAGKSRPHRPIGATMHAGSQSRAIPSSRPESASPTFRSTYQLRSAGSPSPTAALVLVRRWPPPQRQIMEKGCLAALPFGGERSQEKLHQALPTRIRAPRAANDRSSSSSAATAR